MTGPATRLLHLGSLELHATADNSSTRLVIETFGPAELRHEQIEQLADAVLEHLGQTRVDTDRLNETEHALGITEDERDEAIKRAETAEAHLREQLAVVETLKTAGAQADEVQRGLERELAEARELLDRNHVAYVRAVTGWPS